MSYHATKFKSASGEWMMRTHRGYELPAAEYFAIVNDAEKRGREGAGDVREVEVKIDGEQFTIPLGDKSIIKRVIAEIDRQNRRLAKDLAKATETIRNLMEEVKVHRHANAALHARATASEQHIDRPRRMRGSLIDLRRQQIRARRQALLENQTELLVAAE